MFVIDDDANWGTLRSLLHEPTPYTWKAVWFLLDHWPSAEERTEQVLPFCLDYVTRTPDLSRHTPVPYTPWFEDILYRAMLLEARGQDELALNAYQDGLHLKPDCIPAAIAIHRLRGRDTPLLDYCRAHPWERIDGYGSGEDFISFVEALLEGIPNGFSCVNYDDIRDEAELMECLSWDLLEHQGTLYHTTVEALPFLVEILGRQAGSSFAQRLATTLLQYGLCVFDYSTREQAQHQLYDFMERDEEPPAWVVVGSPFRDTLLAPQPGNETEFPWEQRCRRGAMGYNIEGEDDLEHTPTQHIFPPLHVFNRPALSTWELDRFYSNSYVSWSSRNAHQSVASGLPVFARLLGGDTPTKMRWLLTELMHVCGAFGQRMMQDLDITSHR